MALFQKIGRSISYLGPRVGAKTWIFTLFKDNFLPKVGTALAVWPVASIVLSMMVATTADPVVGKVPASVVTKEMAVKLSELTLVANEWWLIGAVIGVGALWCTSMIVRAAYSEWKIENQYLFKFGQLGWLFAAVAQVLLGVILVPVVIIWALLCIVPGVSTDISVTSTLFLTVAYVAVIAAIHYLASVDKEIANTIIYIVETPTMEPAAASVLMLDAMNKSIEGLSWISSPEVVSLSKDGLVVVTLPFLYAEAKWRNEECAQLGARLKLSEQAWVNSGHKIVHRQAPPKVTKNIDPFVGSSPKKASSKPAHASAPIA